MKKYIIGFICLFIILLFTLCHKKDDKPATTSANSNTNNNPNTPCYGFLTVSNYTTEAFGQSYSSAVSRAFFSSQASSYMNYSASVKVGDVSLNNNSLTYDSLYYGYSSYLDTIPVSEAWSVNGANGIPSFTYANSEVFPSCDAVTLPDTIKKSAGFSVNISNVENITSGTFIVYDGSGSLTGSFTTSLHSGNNSISITPANLGNLTTNLSNAMLIVELENATVVSFSGKSFKFIHEAQKGRIMIIVP